MNAASLICSFTHSKTTLNSVIICGDLNNLDIFYPSWKNELKDEKEALRIIKIYFLQIFHGVRFLLSNVLEKPFSNQVHVLILDVHSLQKH